jgi:hypothetical protein
MDSQCALESSNLRPYLRPYLRRQRWGGVGLIATGIGSFLRLFSISVVVLAILDDHYAEKQASLDPHWGRIERIEPGDRGEDSIAIVSYALETRARIPVADPDDWSVGQAVIVLRNHESGSLTLDGEAYLPPWVGTLCGVIGGSAFLVGGGSCLLGSVCCAKRTNFGSTSPDRHGGRST